jgi:hypothetical protein
VNNKFVVSEISFEGVLFKLDWFVWFKSCKAKFSTYEGDFGVF